MADFEINEEGMRQLERDLQQRFSAGIEVPLEGSEDDAVQSVKDQLTQMGATPNDAEVRKLVRDTRSG